uniref:Zinc transporter ZIP13 n=1 Tax=Callorhinchus milii TaxID=7868 RepID=A0A4W3HLA3_CALMI
MVTQKDAQALVLLLYVCWLLPLLSDADIHRANAKKLARKAAATQGAAGNQRWCSQSVFQLRSWSELFVGERVEAWICSMIGAVLVGLTGIFPLLVIPIKAGPALRSQEGCQRLKQLLSFAIGGLLGDVFLHLLPEAWAYTCNRNQGGSQSHEQQRKLGMWVIVGFLFFFVLEKVFPDTGAEEESVGYTAPPRVLNGRKQVKQLSNKKGLSYHRVGCSGSFIALPNGHCRASALKHKVSEQPVQAIKISGYLNLIANLIDNFTHGLAVAGSFLVSRKVGLITTLAILLHEVPHEIGDFAILLRAGFDRWSAAKMQMTTACGGVLGACFALCAQSPEGTGDSVAWILPFTSGGFLYIALVNVAPDLLQETDLCTVYVL